MNRMKRSFVLTAVSIIAACALITTFAHALVIEFEGVADPGSFAIVGTEYMEQGFQLNNPGAENQAAIISSTGFFNSTGSDFYTWAIDSTNNPVELSNTLGLAFDFASLDVGSLRGPGFPVSFDILGNLAGGGTVVENVTGEDAFSNIDLGWSNLTSVEFSWVSGTGDTFAAIDNLDVTPVPEPATMLLLGSGLIGLAGIRRKFKKT